MAGDARASIGVPADDQIVRVRARLDTFASPNGTQERWFGVMARHVDDDNFYFLALRSSNFVSLRKMVNGTVTTLATRSLTVSPGTWYDLRVDAVGDSLRAYVNGNLLLEAVDGTHAIGQFRPGHVQGRHRLRRLHLLSTLTWGQPSKFSPAWSGRGSR